MPVLVQKIIFQVVPDHAPWFLRFLVRFIFGQLDKQLVRPELKKHSALVRHH